MNRKFIGEMLMANKYMKKMFILSTYSKYMQISTTVKNFLPSNRWQTFVKFDYILY